MFAGLWSAVVGVLVDCAQLSIKVIPSTYVRWTLRVMQLSEMVWCVVSTVCARSFITVNPVDVMHLYKLV